MWLMYWVFVGTSGQSIYYKRYPLSCGNGFKYGTIDWLKILSGINILDKYHKRHLWHRLLRFLGKLKFVGSMTEIFIEINKDGNLYCKTTGFGEVTVKWYRVIPNEIPSLKSTLVLIESPSVILQDGTLVMKNVQKENAGNYSCEVKSMITNEIINRTIRLQVGGGICFTNDNEFGIYVFQKNQKS